jgi:mono/diheme cytochrome c family protein
MDAAARKSARAAIAVALLLALAGAAEARSAPRHLRDTGLYASWSERRVRPENIPFSPQYPLWSDGAEKRRWVSIPRGKWVDASRPGAWEFPPGTRFWKEFSFGRPVETRYLERLRDGSWLYATYVWSEDGSDAVLAPELGVTQEVRPGVTHTVPGPIDCRACHEGKTTPVLGFDALQLSSDRDPLAPHARPLAEGEKDLPALIAAGLVRGLPPALLTTPPRIAGSPTTRAALGYLHANCGNCHNDGGPLAPLGLTLAHTEPTTADDEPGLRTTVGQPVRGQVPGVPAGGQRIAAGHPAASALLMRMRSRNPLLQMPPLGTRLVDTEAVALLERWIAEELAPASPPPSPTQLTNAGTQGKETP